MKPNYQKYVPMALAIIGSIGVVATAIATNKATIKALDKPEEERWKCYIPPALLGTGTVACILGSSVLSYRQQASLMSAYAFLNESFLEYKGKVIEKCGIDTHNQIIEELRAEKAEDRQFWSTGLVSSIDGFDDPEEEKKLFYDTFSKRYFEAKPSTVLQAEYYLNRNYVLGMPMTANMWYDYLGITPTEIGDYQYLSMLDSGWEWIDFDHKKVELDGGLECWCIDMYTPFSSDDAQLLAPEDE